MTTLLRNERASTEQVLVGMLARVEYQNEDKHVAEMLWVRVIEVHADGSFGGTIALPSTSPGIDVPKGDAIKFGREHMMGRTRQPRNDHHAYVLMVNDDYRAFRDVMDGLDPDETEGGHYDDSYRLWSAAKEAHESGAELTETESDLPESRFELLVREDMKREARRIILATLGVEVRMTEKAIFTAIDMTDATHEALCELEEDGHIRRTNGTVSLTPEGVAEGART